MKGESIDEILSGCGVPGPGELPQSPATAST